MFVVDAWTTGESMRGKWLVMGVLLWGCPGTSGETTSSSSTGSSSGSASSTAAASSSAAAASSSSSGGATSSTTSSSGSTSSSASGGTWPGCATPPCSWPAEAAGNAENLTDVEGPVPNDFGEDLSGLDWNASTGTLWACRNGGTGGSKVWALEQASSGGWSVATRGGQRAEWTGFGDAESLVQVPAAGNDHVWVLDEGVAVVTEYDLSVGGVATVVRSWNLAPHLPAYDGTDGPEALEFVPNAALAAGGFMHPSGGVAQGNGGTGGLLVVGHQQGGDLYFFDVDYPGTGVTPVGMFKTGGTETAALEFDERTGTLMVWHGAGVNDLEVVGLAWTTFGTARVMNSVVTYDLPGGANHEGMAIADSTRCAGGMRTLWTTIDDGGGTSLLAFHQFPCP